MTTKYLSPRNTSIVPDNQFFDDGIRSIDYVLVYNNTDSDERRRTFVSNMIKKKFELEYAIYQLDSDITFIKIHMKTKILYEYAKKLGIPLRCHHKYQIFEERFLASQEDMAHILRRRIPNAESTRQWPWKLTPSRDVLVNHLTSHERGFIISSILNILPYGETPFATGLQKLLYKQIFLEAYPLHDGNSQWPGDNAYITDRQLLNKFWVDFKTCCKSQPLDLIEKYFGSEIAFYFAWLEFYSKMLRYASFIGVCCFMYSVFAITLTKINYIYEACNSNMTICPLCLNCPSTNMKNYCKNYKIAFLTDNIGVTIFALGISIWAAVFLELWKRQEALLNLKWNLHAFEIEEERPDFQHRAEVRKNEFDEFEHFVSYGKRVRRYMISLATVLLMICLVMATVTAVLLYQFALNKILLARTHKIYEMLVSCSKSLITLITMYFLRRLYEYIVKWLTDFELHRTQSDYERAYILKVFAFSFVNSYGTLIYISFFKGKFYTSPADPKQQLETRVMYTEPCVPSGCSSDMFILMSAIMIFKPIFVNIYEFIYQFISNRHMTIKIRDSNFTTKYEKLTRWEQDYTLNKIGPIQLLIDYEQMMLQYGYIVLFAVAFPLSPLFAFLSNVIKTRIDARKFLVSFPRFEGKKVKSLGIWLDLLRFITYASIVFNACYVVFNTNFIPKMVYRWEYRDTLKGFVNWTLSAYRVNKTIWRNIEEEECRYVGYHYPTGHKHEHQLSARHYYLLAIKLTYILFFENMVFGMTCLITYFVPDVPRSVQSQLLKEAREKRNKGIEEI